MCHPDHQSKKKRNKTKKQETIWKLLSLPIKLEPDILNCFGGERGDKKETRERMSLNHCGFWSCEQ